MQGRAVPYVALLALLSLASAAEARSLSGELIYRERIALPEDAEIAIEVRDAEGRLVTMFREETAGRQVPLPFALEAPDEALSVRAALFVGGEARWASDVIPVTPSAEATSLGPVALLPFRMIGFASTFLCGESTVAVGFAGEGARMRVGGTYFDLAAAPAASGAKFEMPGDAGTYAWSKGNAMTVSVRGAALPECGMSVAAALEPFVARGNEPFWTLTFGNDSVTFDRLGVDPIVGQVSGPEVTPAGRRYSVEQAGLAITVADTVEHDTMTGLPYPHSVTVEVGGKTLTGTGGDPRALLTGVEWRAEDVLGKGIPDNARVTATFTAEGRVAGTAGCNRYTGGYTLTGEGFSFGPAAATRMACPEALMTLERDTFDAFSRTARFDIDDTGALVLLASDGTRLMRMRH